MNRDDDPELWDFLGRSPEPKISPFFARNVVRETRKSGPWGSLPKWISIRRLLPVSGVAVAVAVMALFSWRMQNPVAPLPDHETDIFANVDPQDYDVVADLDDLFAADESNSLDENVLL